MRNMHQLLELAKAHGVPTRKQLRCFDVSGQLRVLEVDVPRDELADELERRGLLGPPANTA
jgi:hypothetical protein